jgi:hypothetical protein
MRIDDVEQRFGDIGKVVVNFFVDPAADEGKRLDQPFGVRVFTLVAFKQQTPGDLGILTGKLHFSNERQFTFVIIKQPVFHKSMSFHLIGVFGQQCHRVYSADRQPFFGGQASDSMRESRRFNGLDAHISRKQCQQFRYHDYMDRARHGDR